MLGAVGRTRTEELIKTIKGRLRIEARGIGRDRGGGGLLGRHRNPILRPDPDCIITPGSLRFDRRDAISLGQGRCASLRSSEFHGQWLTVLRYPERCGR